MHKITDFFEIALKFAQVRVQDLRVTLIYAKNVCRICGLPSYMQNPCAGFVGYPHICKTRVQGLRVTFIYANSVRDGCCCGVQAHRDMTFGPFSVYNKNIARNAENSVILHKNMDAYG